MLHIFFKNKQHDKTPGKDILYKNIVNLVSSNLNI